MTRYVVMAEWNDCPHLSEDAKRELASALPPHQRNARMRGIPQLGSGAIYPVDEDDIVCEPFEFPIWYRHSYGLDVGWNRTAALWTALDPQTDVAYVYSEYYRGEVEPPVHAAAIRSRGTWIPGVIDPASRGRSQSDGTQLLRMYQELQLNISLANNAVESGIYQVWTRLTTGRLKIFRTCVNTLGEFRIYRRDEKGAIVKENDHLMDCLRYDVVSGIPAAAQQPPDNWGKAVGRPKHQVDYNPFSESWKLPSPSGGAGNQPSQDYDPWKG